MVITMRLSQIRDFVAVVESGGIVLRRGNWAFATGDHPKR